MGLLVLCTSCLAVRCPRPAGVDRKSKENKVIWNPAQELPLFLLRISMHVVCFLYRLLKVKPEERLTIEGVLDHPWLNSTEALDNVLPSAQLMMDKVLSETYFVA